MKKWQNHFNTNPKNIQAEVEMMKTRLQPVKESERNSFPQIESISSIFFVLSLSL